MSSASDFMAKVEELSPNEYPENRFPIIWLNEEGDSLEVYFDGEEFNRERVDGRLTLLRGDDSGKVVGVIIKGVRTWIRRVLQEFPGVRFLIKERGVLDLDLLFSVHKAQATSASLALQYDCLKDLSTKLTISTDLLPQDILDEIEVCGG